MTTLTSSDRSRLEKAVLAARDTAEAGVRKRFDALDLTAAEAPSGLSDEDRALRNALRARARNLGRGRIDVNLGNLAAIEQGLPFLVEELAYETWHRMLFARFLAENNLLMHPEFGIALSVDEVRELAVERGEDLWELAVTFAAGRLPGLFHMTSPLRLPTEDRQRLSAILAGLEADLFTAADSLGWVYQFWQSKRKDEVNASGAKITGNTLPPVTQLFTEDYIVDFLLQNSLGAWYVSRHPDTALKAEWPYLRYRDDGTPAAGTFPTWPETVAAVTVMDPCCGSGHFLVAALHMLVAMRQEVEGLAQAEAVDAVLRDNLFGLELDARCTQIATFAVALEAWKLGGHPERHLPHIACSGIPVSGQKQQWTKLAGRDVNMATALEQLYDAFAQASELGSLIDPKRAALMRGGGERGQRGISLVHEWEETERHLHRALMDEQASDPAAQIFSLDDNDLVGTLRAAQLLSRTYTLVVTNVPFLSRGNHGNDLMAFADRNYPEARSNLATMLYFRILGMIQDGGSLAGFSLYDWYFLDSYKDMRRILLDTVSFQIIANLGFKSFRTPMWDFNIGLTILTNSAPSHHHCFAGFDVSNDPGPLAKSESLLSSGSSLVVQLDQHANPDWRILLRAIEAGPRLEEYAEGLHGLGTKDPPRFIRTFWEVNELGVDWNLLQSTPKRNFHYGGLEQMIFWEQGQGLLHERNRRGEAILAGRAAYGREGAIISQMGTLSSAIYMKGLFDKNVAAIVPKSRIHFMAVYAFCSSPQFHDAVRILDAKLYVTNTTLVKVPFNLEHWQAVADERYPDGLPEPFSSDPTQWLFEGTVPGSDHPLQVAMARLLGYRWPDQVEDGLDALADPDGIICLPSVYREPAAADRLRGLLERAYGEDWSAELLATLLRDAGASSLDGWLRDKKGFFAQHVKLFHNRPFLWQISDGRKDGFAAVVNYHRLTTRTLEKLIYTYLEDWINRQRRAADRQEAGAQAGLEAATRLRQELIKIAGGEPPYDIYVRWKSLAEQPIGWEPDLNDGVRLNIRPFIEANVLASKVNVKWGKDRGNDPAVRTEPLRESADADLKSRIDRHTSVERHNDLHFSRAEKVRARQLAATEATAPV